ncbi:hypothetical protein Peur_012899 [Populus x canadensis]
MKTGGFSVDFFDALRRPGDWLIILVGPEKRLRGRQTEEWLIRAPRKGPDLV